MIKLEFHVVNDTMYCETCGGGSNEEITVSLISDKPTVTFSTGGSAHCYDYDAPDMELLRDTVIEMIAVHGYAIPAWEKNVVSPEDQAAYDALPKQLRGEFSYDTCINLGYQTYDVYDLKWRVEREFEEEYYGFQEGYIGTGSVFLSTLRKLGIKIEVDESHTSTGDYGFYMDYEDEDEYTDEDE